MPPFPRSASGASLPPVYGDDIVSHLSGSTPSSLLAPKHGKSTSISDWGFPGHLTESEFKAYETFRAEVYQRGHDFKSTVFCFKDAGEDEKFALCRWLRARKFNLHETLKMVEEATQCRAIPVSHGFFSDPETALGVEPAIYLSQYPQLHYGYAKNGCPLFISKPGVLNVNGLECIATIEGIVRYHWYDMAHNFVKTLHDQHVRDPTNFKRYECICVVDLANLSASQVSKRALNIVKVQSQIDSLCFPETLNRMIIINAPTFFSMTWKIIRGYVDARTAAKVEIISSRKSWVKRLKELVDDSQLPHDYAGQGVKTQLKMDQGSLKIGKDKNLKRVLPTVFSVRTSDSTVIQVNDNEVTEISVFTRSLSGGVFTISCLNDNVNVGKPFVVKHVGKGTEQEKPTRIDFQHKLHGPGRFKIKVESNSGRFYTEHFLLAGKVFPAKSREVVREHEEEKKEESPCKHKHRAPSPPTSLVDISLSTPVSTRKTVQKSSQTKPDRPRVGTHGLPKSCTPRKENPSPKLEEKKKPKTSNEYSDFSDESEKHDDTEALCSGQLFMCGALPPMSKLFGFLSRESTS